MFVAFEISEVVFTGAFFDKRQEIFDKHVVGKGQVEFYNVDYVQIKIKKIHNKDLILKNG